MTWVEKPDAPPWLHVGYDLYVPRRSRRARIAIVSTGATLEDALAGEPWTRVINELRWLGEGRGQLPYTHESPWR